MNINLNKLLKNIEKEIYNLRKKDYNILEIKNEYKKIDNDIKKIKILNYKNLKKIIYNNFDNIYIEKTNEIFKINDNKNDKNNILRFQKIDINIIYLIAIINRLIDLKKDYFEILIKLNKYKCDLELKCLYEYILKYEYQLKENNYCLNEIYSKNKNIDNKISIKNIINDCDLKYSKINILKFLLTIKLTIKNGVNNEYIEYINSVI